MNYNTQMEGNTSQVCNKICLASSLALLALASEEQAIPPLSLLSSVMPVLVEGVVDSICRSPLSNTGLTVVDNDTVPLHPVLSAATMALSKRPLLSRLFPHEAVDVDVIVAANADVKVPEVRFSKGPMAPPATLG